MRFRQEPGSVEGKIVFPLPTNYVRKEKNNNKSEKRTGSSEVWLTLYKMPLAKMSLRKNILLKIFRN